MKKLENCIEVKNAFNLSVNYLTRFFGSAGPVLSVTKDQNAKLVLIEFVNKNSAEKAFRYDARVLDQNPIKIRKPAKEIQLNINHPPNTKQSQPFKLQQFKSNQPQNQPEQIEEQPLETKIEEIRSEKDIWKYLKQQLLRGCELKVGEEDRIIVSLLLWDLLSLKWKQISCLLQHHLNWQTIYWEYQLQKCLIDKMEKLNQKGIVAVTHARERINLTRKKNKVLLEVYTPYINVQQDQAKSLSNSIHSHLHKELHKFNHRIAYIYSQFHSNSLIPNFSETNLHLNEEELEKNNLRCLGFNGIISNIGAKDIFYELKNFKQANSIIIYDENSNKQNPISLLCSLRLVNCKNKVLQQLSFCQYLQPSLNLSGYPENFLIFCNHDRREAISFQNHNLIFEEAQFQIIGMLLTGLQYYKSIMGSQEILKLFFVRLGNASEPIQEIYKLSNAEASKVSEIMDLINTNKITISIVSLRPDSHHLLNQLKLQHFLIKYIDESVLQKGLIISSQEMAVLLAKSIIEKEKDDRLFQFASEKHAKFIGGEIWRLYLTQHARKTKNILESYQIKRTSQK